MQLLLQFSMNYSETLQASSSWSVLCAYDLGIVVRQIFTTFLLCKLCHFSTPEDLLSTVFIAAFEYLLPSVVKKSEGT